MSPVLSVVTCPQVLTAKWARPLRTTAATRALRVRVTTKATLTLLLLVLRESSPARALRVLTSVLSVLPRSRLVPLKLFL